MLLFDRTSFDQIRFQSEALMDSPPQPQDLGKIRVEAVKKAALRFGFLIVSMFTILFLAAGTVRWWEAWAYVAMSLVVLVSSRVYMLIKRPEMALERAEAGSKENVKSWDKFLIPKPFSEVTIEWGQPFVVPRDIDPARFEELRKEIEQSLSEGHAEADLSSGWKHPL